MTTYIKTIIVEDEKQNSNLLCYFLEKHCPMLLVEGIAKNIEEAKEMIKLKKPALVFLDIHLENKLIFELFEDKDLVIDFQIIFTTAFEEYALKAFQYNTIDYLLKPINITDLKRAVNKVINNYNELQYPSIQMIKTLEGLIKNEQNKNQKVVPISSQTEILLIKEDDILFCSSQRKYTIFHFTNGKECVSSKNIGEYEKLLSPVKFFRIHNSYIINLTYLIKIDKTKDYYCELINGELLPLAKRRREQLKNILNII